MKVIGYIKGKSAIHLARVYGERKSNFVGQHFWARGYFVYTVGRDEAMIREYIRHQEAEDKRLEQLNLWRRFATFRWRKKRGAALATEYSRNTATSEIPSLHAARLRLREALLPDPR